MVVVFTHSVPFLPEQDINRDVPDTGISEVSHSSIKPHGCILYIYTISPYDARFCLQETTCDQNDYYPKQCYVKVNSHNCPIAVSSLSLLIFSLPLCRTLLPRPPLSFPPSPPVLTFSEFLCRFPLRRVQEKWQKRTMKSRLEVNCTSCSLPCDKNVCMNRWEQAVCSTSILPPPPPLSLCHSGLPSSPVHQTRLQENRTAC